MYDFVIFSYMYVSLVHLKSSSKLNVACYWMQFAAISRHLANSLGRSLLRSAFFRVRPHFICGNLSGRGFLTQQIVDRPFSRDRPGSHLWAFFNLARVNGIGATWTVHIEEVDDCNKCQRAQRQGAWRGWQVKYGCELSENGNAALDSITAMTETTKGLTRSSRKQQMSQP
jgi:hypothetical protein